MGESVQYGYDALGNLVRKTDEDGLETLYAYNAANQLSQVTYADGRTVELSYNPLKQLTQMRDWLGATDIEMDSQGRVAQVTDFEGKKVSYGWDGEGRREKLVYPDGSEVRYGYDALGHLASVRTAEGETRYGYDALGRMRERELPGGIRTEYGLDVLGRLESLTHRRGEEVLDAFRYGYDPAGNITSIDKQRAGMPEDSGLFTYEYDALNRLTAAARGEERKEYAYDSLGNRIAEALAGRMVRHSYNGRNQLIRSEDDGEKTDYRYDHRGNLTEVLRNNVLEASYTFDATNMLAKAYSAERGEAEYAYDGLRNRVKRLERLAGGGVLRSEAQAGLDPCAEMRYVLDLTRPYDNLLMTEQSGRAERYVWGHELLGAIGENKYFFLQDHLHSPIRLIDGEEAWEDEAYAYDEFGVRKAEVAKIERGTQPQGNADQLQGGIGCRNPFGFTGYQPDAVSGLCYAQARYYDPANARMVAEDPIKSGLNWYAYCGGNPVRFLDANGMEAADFSTYDSVLEDPLGAFDYVGSQYGKGIMKPNVEALYLEAQRRLAHPTNTESDEAIKAATVSNMVMNMHMKDEFGDQYKTRDEYFEEWKPEHYYSKLLRDANGNLYEHNGPYAMKNYDKVPFNTGFSGITIHHSDSAVRAVPRTATEIILLHWDKNLSDVGYHFIIERDGVIYEGRPLTIQGAHNNNNTGNIGIVLGSVDTR